LYILIYVLFLTLCHNRFFTILRETDEKESRGGRVGGGGKVAGPAGLASTAAATSRKTSAAGAALESAPGLLAVCIPTDLVPFEYFLMNDFRTSAALIKQVDYYFSDANWAKDKFLQQAADADGYVSISVLGTFKV
jgi:hypothetical protein